QRQRRGGRPGQGGALGVLAGDAWPVRVERTPIAREALVEARRRASSRRPLLHEGDFENLGALVADHLHRRLFWPEIAAIYDTMPVSSRTTTGSPSRRSEPVTSNPHARNSR